MARTYKITQIKQTEDILITTVEYDFDGTKITVDVGHFQPQSLDDIKLGIRNRMASERARLVAANRINNLKSSIELNVENTEA